MLHRRRAAPVAEEADPIASYRESPYRGLINQLPQAMREDVIFISQWIDDRPKQDRLPEWASRSEL